MSKFFWSIELKFLAFVLPPVIVATLIASVLFGVATFRDMMREFRDAQTQTVAETALAVADPMWNFDRKNTQRLLEAVVDGDVRNALVLDQYDKEFITVGDISGRGGDTASLPITFEWGGKSFELGTIIITFDTSEIRRAIGAQIVRDSVYLLLLVLFVVLGAFVTNKGVVRRPLEALIASIRSSGRNGNYEPVKWRSNDELGEVIETYNQMVQRITDEGIALREAIVVAEREREKAERLARTDPLTGMNNRRAFFDYGRLVEDQSRRTGRPYTVIMLDIDHFKSVNDVYGHQAGDDLLREVAIAVSAVVRASDIPGRIGGEEFAVILPETAAEEAMVLAERLRRHIADISMAVDGRALSATSSFGVSESADGKERIEKIINQADTALYKSKEGGRNRVSLYGPA